MLILKFIHQLIKYQRNVKDQEDGETLIPSDLSFIDIRDRETF